MRSSAACAAIRISCMVFSVFLVRSSRRLQYLSTSSRAAKIFVVLAVAPTEPVFFLRSSTAITATTITANATIPMPSPFSVPAAAMILISVTSSFPAGSTIARVNSPFDSALFMLTHCFCVSRIISHPAWSSTLYSNSGLVISS